MTVKHLKCNNLYKIAKNIFGDIILSAYVEAYSQDEAQFLSNKYRKYKSYDESVLSYDADTIVLEFKNGNKVTFTNSEWASMSKCNNFNPMK